MVRLAELAVCEARTLSVQRYGRPALADLRARAWAALGNAFRVADDLFSADTSLKQALRWARRGSGDDLLAARITDLMASLWADQGHFADAIEVLEHLAELYEELGDLHLAGRAWISRGIFLGQDCQPRQAVVSLSLGLSLIDPDRDPGVRLSGFHVLVSMLADLGRYREARIHLWRLQRLYEDDGSPLIPPRRDWLWGKIVAGLGDLARAEKYLGAARDGLAGKSYDRALVDLDLAQVYVRQHRRDEARLLAQKMLPTFKRLGIAREVVAVLILTRERCLEPSVPAEDLCQSFREVAVLLAELERARPRLRRRGT